MPKILENASNRHFNGKITFSKVPPNVIVASILPLNQPNMLYSMPKILQNASNRDFIANITFSKVPPNTAVAFILPLNQPIDP